MPPSDPAAQPITPLKIKYKSRPASRKSNTPADPRSIGPARLGETPECTLLAAVIRQAVEDYAVEPAALDFIYDQKFARMLLRARDDADQFFFEGGLEEFLTFFGVEDVFHAPTIIRTFERIVGMTAPVRPHRIPPTVIPPFEPSTVVGSAIAGNRAASFTGHQATGERD